MWSWSQTTQPARLVTGRDQSAGYARRRYLSRDCGRGFNSRRLHWLQRLRNPLDFAPLQVPNGAKTGVGRTKELSVFAGRRRGGRPRVGRRSGRTRPQRDAGSLAVRSVGGAATVARFWLLAGAQREAGRVTTPTRCWLRSTMSGAWLPDDDDRLRDVAERKTPRRCSLCAPDGAGGCFRPAGARCSDPPCRSCRRAALRVGGWR